MSFPQLKLKVQLFILVTTVYTAVGIMGGIILEFLIPVDYFGVYPAISVFYLALGLILTYSLDRIKDTHPDKLMHVFMLTKMVKFVLTLVFLVLYVTHEPEVKMPFSISLMCNYFIYSFLEIYIYYLYNKRLTYRMGKKNKNATKE